MTVDTQTIRNLLSCNENDRIDFKQEFYDLSGDTKEQKNAKAAAMIKDILSLCNTIRNESAYIVCGVREEGNVRIVCGLTNLPPDDADLQGKLSARTTPVPKFQLRTRTFENKWIAIIEIPVFPYSTPPTSTKDLPGIVQNQVYIRRGSRNSEANPQEIFLITQWLRNLERAFFPTLTPLDPNL
ncbi:MAG TPA: ATP-binding protein, partial [Leptospiraceae bacterium]|nr:ATP-binding protein [Leptospiraceae bacterium]